MNSTRAIAITGLGIALALAVGALQPARPGAEAGTIRPIFSTAPAQARPTPALPTALPTTAPLVEQPSPQVVYVQLPAQVVYVQQPTAQVVYVEQPAQVVYVEQPAAPVVEQPAGQVEQPAGEIDSQPAGQVDSFLEIEQAAAAVYRDANLPTAGPMPPTSEPRPMTDRDRQYSRQRTR